MQSLLYRPFSSFHWWLVVFVIFASLGTLTRPNYNYLPILRWTMILMWMKPWLKWTPNCWNLYLSWNASCYVFPSYQLLRLWRPGFLLLHFVSGRWRHLQHKFQRVSLHNRIHSKIHFNILLFFSIPRDFLCDLQNRHRLQPRHLLFYEPRLSRRLPQTLLQVVLQKPQI